MTIDDPLKRWLCLGCGFSYDEAMSMPEHDIAPGTRWRDIPDGWVSRLRHAQACLEMVELPYAPEAEAWARFPDPLPPRIVLMIETSFSAPPSAASTG